MENEMEELQEVEEQKNERLWKIRRKLGKEEY